MSDDPAASAGNPEPKNISTAKHLESPTKNDALNAALREKKCEQKSKLVSQKMKTMEYLGSSSRYQMIRRELGTSEGLRHQKDLLKGMNQMFAKLEVSCASDLEYGRKATLDSYKMALCGYTRAILAHIDLEGCKSVPGFQSLLEDAPMENDVEFGHFLGVLLYRHDDLLVQTLARSVMWLGGMIQVPMGLFATMEKCLKCRTEAFSGSSEQL